MKKLRYALLVTIAALPAVHAEVKLPAIISDHMVLQSAVEVPIWGWADPGEEVAISFAGQTKSTKADAAGKWAVKLDKLKSGGEAQTLTAKGKNTIAVADVLVGEVWLASGQSNMVLQVSRANDPEKESAAATFPAIRMFTENSGAAASAQEDGKGTWAICEPATVGRFSATAYFFGRELHKTLGVPVGLITSAVGGTPIESWISPEAQQSSAELKAAEEAAAKAEPPFNAVAAKAKFDRDLAKWKEDAAKAKAEGKTTPRAPRDPVALREKKGNRGGLFNGKIAPLIPYAIRGAIWYQGEANSMTAKAPLYQRQLTTLITDWRTRWASELPFAWVQLPNFDGGEVRDWPTVREGMLKTLEVPKTG
ncbi:MAG: sialate O-acetylesterase, partial [Chthoniobacteraceae bacterium]